MFSCQAAPSKGPGARMLVDFQKSPSSDFIWRGTSRDFLARGRPLRGQTRLAPLAKKSTSISKSSMLAKTEVVFNYPCNWLMLYERMEGRAGAGPGG